MPQAVLTYCPENETYGFSVWFEGRRPHYAKEGFQPQKKRAAGNDPAARVAQFSSGDSAGGDHLISIALTMGLFTVPVSWMLTLPPVTFTV